MSLLQWETSQTGEPVPRWNGRLLASRLDPAGEARDWLDKRGVFLDKIKSVFVLGAGGGFHIAEVLRRNPAVKVVVIEKEEELVRAVVAPLSERFGARLTAVITDRASELRSQPAVREALLGSFVVLEHPASVASSREFYGECAALLGAREWGALTWQWRLKGLPDFDSEPRVSRSKDALTVLDLEQTALVQNSTEREKLLLKALRELVK